MRPFKMRVLRAASAMIAGGTLFQIGNCTPSGILHFTTQNLNPCGTVLACDPSSYGFLSSNYDGPGVDASIDPFCTFPPFCDPNDDPLISNDQIP
jgi:hypothetical protein